MPEKIRSKKKVMSNVRIFNHPHYRNNDSDNQKASKSVKQDLKKVEANQEMLFMSYVWKFQNSPSG